MIEAIVIAAVVIACIAFGAFIANVHSWLHEDKSSWLPRLYADERRRINDDVKPKRDYRTAMCPICGKYDPSKPFITGAIDCSREDCGFWR